jgi:hypothetical protein
LFEERERKKESIHKINKNRREEDRREEQNYEYLHFFSLFFFLENAKI